MEYDTQKVDEAVLALLFLTMFEEHGVTRAWKGHDWDALNRLHDTGYIHDPRSKAKSVVVLDPDVAAAFLNSESVNRALRKVAGLSSEGSS